MYQRFKFKGYTGYTSDGNWDAPESALGWSFSRNISFAEKFGVILALEVIREDDMIVFDTRLKPVRALLHTTGEQSQGGGTRSVEESTGVTIEWDDFNCAFSGQGSSVRKNMQLSSHFHIIRLLGPSERIEKQPMRSFLLLLFVFVAQGVYAQPTRLNVVLLRAS